MSEIAKIDAAIDLRLSLAQVRLVRRRMAEVVRAAESASDLLRELSGPQPGDFAAMLKVQSDMGAGYFRACRDTIDRAVASLQSTRSRRP